MSKKIAAAAALLIASSASFAAQPNTFYAGADVGRTRVEDFNKHDTSVGAFVGYNVNANLAVEAGLRRLADFDHNYPSIGGGFHPGDAKLDQTHLSLVGSLPVGESFSVYGRLGVNHLEARFRSSTFSRKDSATKALYGIGASYAFSPTVSARVEVQKPSNDTNNVSAGLSYQF